MDINTLISMLEQIREEHGNLEVKLMEQPSWPFEYDIAGLAISSDFVDEDDDEPSEGEDEPLAVFICEGSQLRYGTKAAWDVCSSN